jgi:hypothetical protein
MTTRVSLAKTPRRLNFIHVTCYKVSLYVVDFKCAPQFWRGTPPLGLNPSSCPTLLPLRPSAALFIRN